MVVLIPKYARLLNNRYWRKKIAKTRLNFTDAAGILFGAQVVTVGDKRITLRFKSQYEILKLKTGENIDHAQSIIKEIIGTDLLEINYVTERDVQYRGITKICFKCKQEKPASEFYKGKRTPDGLQSYCKECGRTYREQWDKKQAPVGELIEPSHDSQGEDTESELKKNILIFTKSMASLVTASDDKSKDATIEQLKAQLNSKQKTIEDTNKWLLQMMNNK